VRDPAVATVAPPQRGASRLAGQPHPEGGELVAFGLGGVRESFVLPDERLRALALYRRFVPASG
jgi:hypothetical protein